MPSSRQDSSYTDTSAHSMFINSYNYAEFFGEKIQELGERGRLKDLYDVINLFHNNHLPAAAVIKIFCL